MLRFIVVPVLFAAFLFGAVNNAELLKRADKLTRSGDKTEVFRAYNDYKNIYLRSMMNHDDDLRHKALEGIVKSGGILRIDVARYESELKTFKPSAASPTAKTPETKPGKTVQPPSGPDAGLQTLESVRWNDGRLMLNFERKLQPHEINYFKLFDKEARRYRYIFDVDATMSNHKEELRHSEVKRISLARYNAEKLRLVIENDRPLKIRFKRSGSSLVINPGVGPDTTPEPKEENVTLSERLHLNEALWRDGKLVLQFDRSVQSDAVSVSKLENIAGERYRYIFDVDRSMLDKDHDLRHARIKRLKLAQFDSKTVRLVLENDSQLDISYAVSGNELRIDPGLGLADAPKSMAALQQSAAFEKVIVLDPGHGGKDVGAVGYKNAYEKNVVFGITKALSDILKQQGYKVYMTRTGDKFIKLQKRTQFANKHNADLFVSIHANAVPKQNASKAYGIETYFLSNDHEAGSERAKRVAQMENSKDLQDVNYYGQQDFINILNREKIKKSERLAYDLQRNILAVLQKKYTRVKDGGVREGPFWILVGAQMPAVLVEVGFITHPMESKRLVKSDYQQQFAEGLANGINQYFINNP